MKIKQWRIPAQMIDATKIRNATQEIHRWFDVVYHPKLKRRERKLSTLQRRDSRDSSFISSSFFHSFSSSSVPAPPIYQNRDIWGFRLPPIISYCLVAGIFPRWIPRRAKNNNKNNSRKSSNKTMKQQRRASPLSYFLSSSSTKQCNQVDKSITTITIMKRISQLLNYHIYHYVHRHYHF